MITGLVGGGIDAGLAQLAPLLGEGHPSSEREAVLAATHNPLTISMRLRRGGRPLELTTQAMKEAITELSGKVVVLVHGLCMSDLQWN
jgi:hypothetical protein